MGATIYGVRCHRATPRTLHLARELQRAFGPERVWLFTDETQHTETWPDDIQRLALTREYLTRFPDLPRVSSIGWRCGDLFFYLAADHLAFEYMWLIESDVYFHTDNIAALLEPAESRFDLSAFNLGRADESWYWTASMRSAGYSDIYRCLFPLVRMSRAAIEACAAGRKDIHRAFDPRRDIYPNDEAFVATQVVLSGFSHVRLEHLLAGKMSRFQYRNKYRLSELLPRLRSEQVIHSALDDREFEDHALARATELLSQAPELTRFLTHHIEYSGSQGREELKELVLRALGRRFDELSASVKDSGESFER